MAFPRKLALAGLALLSLAAAPAHATITVTAFQYAPEIMTGPDQGAPDFGGINIDSAGAPYNTYQYGGNAGRFLTSIFDSTTNVTTQEYTFCTDAITGFFTSDPYTIQPVSSLTLDTAKQQQLAALLTNASAVIDGAATQQAAVDASAGIQLAVWAIVYDTGVDSNYNLSSGNFTTYGDFGPASAPYMLASTYLDNAQAGGIWAKTSNPLLVRNLVQVPGDDPATQNQIFITPAAVPEPKTWLTMFLGFGCLGAALRRRRNLAALPA